MKKSVSLQLNNIGDSVARANYKNALVDYLSGHKESLDADSLRRLDTNPLRILDSKNPAMQSLLNDAPALGAYLSEDSVRARRAAQQYVGRAGHSGRAK